VNDLSARLEAVLFVANEPLTAARLGELTGHKPADIITALGELEQALAQRGLRLTRHQGAFRLVTAPEHSDLIRRFLVEDARTELTKPALETLAIVAYRGPLTKTAIEEIRGVSSDAMLRNLQQRGLISEQGLANEPGRPTLYAVSQSFLQEFGFSSVEELPPLDEVAEA
jgi:segregation and condensation protein B